MSVSGNRRSVLVWLTLSLAWALMGAASVAHGAPLMSRFPVSSSTVQNFYSVSQTRDGRILVGGDEGVVEFDGVRFRETEYSGPVRIMVPDGERVWSGGFGKFGYLQREQTGELRFTDISGPFKARMGERALADVWDLAVRPEGIWFVSLFDLFLSDTEGKVLGHWHNPKRFGRISTYQGSTVIQWRGEGLRRWSDWQWIALPDSSSWSAPVATVLKPLDDNTLVSVQSAGGVRQYASGAARLLETGLKSERITHAVQLPDRTLVLSTDDGYVVPFDGKSAGTPLKISTRFVNRLHLDPGGAIWAVSGNELIRIQWPGRWAQFGEAQGVRNTLIGLRHSGGRLHALSYGHVNEIHDGKVRTFAPPNASGAYWDVERVGNDLLLAGQFNLEQQIGGRWETVGPKELYPRAFVRSERDPGLVFVATSIGLGMVRRNDTGWQWIAYHPSLQAWITDVFEDPDVEGRLWIAGMQGGVQQLDFNDGWRTLNSRKTLLAPAAGSTKPEIRLSRVGGQFLASSRQGLFQWTGKSFEPTSLNGLPDVTAPREVVKIQVDRQGTWWAAGVAGVYRRESGGQWVVDEIKSFRTGNFTDLEVLPDGGVAIACEGSVFVLTPREMAQGSGSINAFLTEASVRRGNVPLEAMSLQSGAVLKPRVDAMTFSIGLTDYARHVPPGFQARLLGLSEEWSEWGPSARFEFGKLGAGQYKFEARARDSGGHLHALPGYEFTVEPAWSESVLSRFLLVTSSLFLLVGAVTLGIRWRTRRLDEIVASRTAELAHANQRLQDLAVMDGLTGVFNRRRFDELMNDLLEEAHAHQSPLCLLLIDIDNFKQFNDANGHLAGDDVLRAVGTLLQGAGYAARYGGEEFALLLPQSDVEAARARAEEVRVSIARLPLGVTASIGLAQVRPGGRETAVEMIARADGALYAAKRAGRNQVVIAD